MNLLRAGLLVGTLMAAAAPAPPEHALAPRSQGLPQAGAVPDRSTALAIGRALFVGLAGAAEVEAEAPFTAVRTGDAWMVRGKYKFGGLFAEFSARDCRVTSLELGK